MTDFQHYNDVVELWSNLFCKFARSISTYGQSEFFHSMKTTGCNSHLKNFLDIDLACATHFTLAIKTSTAFVTLEPVLNATVTFKNLRCDRETLSKINFGKSLIS